MSAQAVFLNPTALRVLFIILIEPDPERLFQRADLLCLSDLSPIKGTKYGGKMKIPPLSLLVPSC